MGELGKYCCDPLESKKELCEQCPHFSNCSIVHKKEIKDNFETDKQSNTKKRSVTTPLDDL